jgi:hypothetical protein
LDQQVAAPDVDDEGYGRPDCCDVGKVLLWTHTEIHASRVKALHKVRNHSLV